MAGIKISDLPAAPVSLLTDVFPADQGAVTYKETLQQVLTLFQSNGAALSRINDTNVTMTLGGSPTTALLNAASMTLGWTGNLAVGRGGTGNTTFTAYSVICAGTTATGSFQNVSGVGSANQVLVSNGAAALPSWQAVPGLTPAALTRVDDTNVTLTLGGSPTTALLQATSITAGWAGQLSLARGGSNANLTAVNGGIVYSNATAMAISAAGSAGQLFQSAGAGTPVWTTATYPAIATGTGKILRADGTNWVASTATYPDTAGTSGNILTSDGTNWLSSSPAGVGSPLTTKGDLYTFSTLNARLAVGSTNGQILQVSSGAATGLAWSTATFPSTATNTARILRADGTNWVQTTSTFADTYAASGVLYANGANNVAGLATANNGVLTTDGSGVPSITTLANLGINASLVKTVKRQVIIATGSYIPSAGLIAADVEGVGGGGGGGGVSCSAGNTATSGGGGGGGYFRKLFTAAEIGANAAVTIGAAGAGGAAGNNNGVAGGDTIFDPAGTGVTLTGAGGALGQGCPTQAGNGVPVNSGQGGAGTNGDINISGEAPNYPVIWAFASGIGMSGAGGRSQLGPGSSMAFSATGASTPTSGYGGGGSGTMLNANSTAVGGAGRIGVVIVTEYCNQ